jgi:hypothetical protein
MVRSPPGALPLTFQPDGGEGRPFFCIPFGAMYTYIQIPEVVGIVNDRSEKIKDVRAEDVKRR